MTEGIEIPPIKEAPQESREGSEITELVNQTSLDPFTFVVSAYTRLRSGQGEYCG
jgi:hypothetical protein